MTVNEDFSRFADLVQRMRFAQNDYFKSRSTPRLMAAKALELQVDQAVTEIMRIRPTREVQQTLFGETPGQSRSALTGGK